MPKLAPVAQAVHRVPAHPESLRHPSSTIVTSQLEPKDWHSVIGDATLADAICDRLVHNAHRLKLGGDSIRKAEGLTGGKKPAK